MESGQSAQRNSQNRSVKLACRSSNTAKHREHAAKNMKETKKREGKWNGRVVPLAPSNIRIHECAIVVVVWIHHCRAFLSACKTVVQWESDYDTECQKTLRLSKSILVPSVQRRQILRENDSFLSREQSTPVAAPNALKLDLYWVLNDTLCRNDEYFLDRSVLSAIKYQIVDETRRKHEISDEAGYVGLQIKLMGLSLFISFSFRSILPRFVNVGKENRKTTEVR